MLTQGTKTQIDMSALPLSNMRVAAKPSSDVHLLQSAGSAAPRPEKRMKLEIDSDPAPFSKRASNPPYARGAYNSEEWVFDDEDDEDDAVERYHFGHDDETQNHNGSSLPEVGIRTLEVCTLSHCPGCINICKIMASWESLWRYKLEVVHIVPYAVFAPARLQVVKVMCD